MKNMLNALGARREALQDGEGQKGFTLIELLVVVIIIGILAAIAVPVYLGIQDSAKDSAVKSDLANAKIAVIGYMTDNVNTGTAPTTYSDAHTALFGAAGTTVSAAGTKYGATLSSNTTSILPKTDAAFPFCLVGISKSADTPSFNVTEKGVRKGSGCGIDG